MEGIIKTLSSVWLNLFKLSKIIKFLSRWVWLLQFNVISEDEKSYFTVLYSAKKEEPKMEKNVYYGPDDEYYDEQDNRVEDRNNYYE